MKENKNWNRERSNSKGIIQSERDWICLPLLFRSYFWFSLFQEKSESRIFFFFFFSEKEWERDRSYTSHRYLMTKMSSIRRRIVRSLKRRRFRLVISSIISPLYSKKNKKKTKYIFISVIIIFENLKLVFFSYYYIVLYLLSVYMFNNVNRKLFYNVF